MLRIFAITFFLGLFLSACDMHDPQVSEPSQEDAPTVELRIAPNDAIGKRSTASGADDRAAVLQLYLQQVNADLASRGLDIAVEKAEWVGGGESHEAGQTVFAIDRDLRLSSQWISGDARRNANDDVITHVLDQRFKFANSFNQLPEIDADPPIDASFETWNDVTCSKLKVIQRPDNGENYSALLNIGGPGNIFYADISTIGFLPGDIFDEVLGPGASGSVLGVTFTLIFVDGDGNPTDVNNDGYADTAIKEVWYNDWFAWSTDGSFTDIETVALHENGHALGLGHFGDVFVTNANNKLHVSPRAVMNAFILGTLREPLGTDNGAYCGLYGAWPN